MVARSLGTISDQLVVTKLLTIAVSWLSIETWGAYTIYGRVLAPPLSRNPVTITPEPFSTQRNPKDSPLSTFPGFMLQYARALTGGKT